MCPRPRDGAPAATGHLATQRALAARLEEVIGDAAVLGVRDAAAVLGVHHNTVRNHCARGLYRVERVMANNSEMILIERASFMEVHCPLTLGDPSPANVSLAAPPATALSGAEGRALIAAVGALRERVEAQDITEMRRTLGEMADQLSRVMSMQERLLAQQRQQSRVGFWGWLGRLLLAAPVRADGRETSARTVSMKERP